MSTPIIEKELNMQGMKRMDHGELFKLIQSNPHSGAKAINLWLPYGKALSIIESFKKIDTYGA